MLTFNRNKLNWYVSCVVTLYEKPIEWCVFVIFIERIANGFTNFHIYTCHVCCEFSTKFQICCDMHQTKKPHRDFISPMQNTTIFLCCAFELIQRKDINCAYVVYWSFETVGKRIENGICKKRKFGQREEIWSLSWHQNASNINRKQHADVGVAFL